MKFKRNDRVYCPATGGRGRVRGFMFDPAYNQDMVVWVRDGAPRGQYPFDGPMLSCVLERDLEFEALADVIELDNYRITTIVERLA